MSKPITHADIDQRYAEAEAHVDGLMAACGYDAETIAAIKADILSTSKASPELVALIAGTVAPGERRCLYRFCDGDWFMIPVSKRAEFELVDVAIEGGLTQPLPEWAVPVPDVSLITFLDPQEL